MERMYDVYDKLHGHFIVALPTNRGNWGEMSIQRVNSFLEDQGMISVNNETVTVTRILGSQTFLVGPTDHSFTVIL